MRINCLQHPKLMKLMALLEKPRYQAAGVLECLWLFAAEYADDGRLDRFTPKDIGLFLGFDGDVDRLFEALVETGFLDRDGDGALSIHDWREHCPKFISDRLAKRLERTGTTQKRRLSEGVEKCPKVSENVDTSPAQPSPAPPNNSSELPSETAERVVFVFPCNGKVKTWALTQPQVDRWRELFPGVDVMRKCRDLLAWAEANPTKRKTAGGWPRCISTALSKEQDRPSNGNSATPKAPAASTRRDGKAWAAT